MDNIHRGNATRILVLSKAVWGLESLDFIKILNHIQFNREPNSPHVSDSTVNTSLEYAASDSTYISKKPTYWET